MDILILGNGFDLAHGLKTRYSDFLDYCKNNRNFNSQIKRSTNVFFTNLWMRHFITRQSKMNDSWIDLETEIYNVVKKCISNFQNLVVYDNFRILDFDYGYSSFSFYEIDRFLEKSNNELHNTRGYVRYDLNNESRYKIYFESRKGVVNFLYDQLRDFTKAFDEYLVSEVMYRMSSESKYKLSLNSIGVTKGNKNVFVLNFNYTNTCEKLYKEKFNTYCNLTINPVYVHGKSKVGGNCNLVLGIKSLKKDDFPVNFNTVDFNIFKKHTQRHKYGTIEAYQDLVRKIKKSKTQPVFHIIGHSLDETDHNILKHILLANDDAMINIYYHDIETQEKLINNITEIIGEDEVMAKVRFIDQHDTERGILIHV